MVYPTGLLLVALTLQLRFFPLPPVGQAHSYVQYSARTPQPLPFAPEALAYQFTAQKIASEFGRERYLPSGATDSSTLQAEATQLSDYRSQHNTQNDLLQLWDSVSEDLEQAWRSIRVMFR